MIRTVALILAKGGQNLARWFGKHVPRISAKTRTRLHGAYGLGKIVSGRNAIVGAVRTVRDAYKASHELVKGKRTRSNRIIDAI